MDEPMRILVVDDEDSVRKRCVRLLARQGYEVIGAADGMAALDIIRATPCDVVLADIRMPGMDGIELLKRIKEFDASAEVIVMTGYATVETAVKAMKSGAYDYLTKPFEVDELLHVVKNVAEKKQLQREVEELKGLLRDQSGGPFLVGSSPVMNEVYRFIEKVAPVGCNILLMGESGTGKELVAKSIHARSPRKDNAFVVADCAALSGPLLESELFGHVKGAFTGAYTDRKGYFQTADKGTIFLDEIGELPLDLQGVLLRAVEDNVIYKIGSSKQLHVDVRIIAATNRNLEESVKRKAFREDLFYRLNVVSLRVPPLRERLQDLPLLLQHFINRYAAQLGIAKTPRIDDGLIQSLVRYHWPGNVRELENAVQRALVLAEDGRISLQHLIPVQDLSQPDNRSTSMPQSGSFQEMRNQVVQDFTYGYVQECLRRCRGNVTQAAKALGLRRTSLQRLLRKIGLSADGFR